MEIIGPIYSCEAGDKLGLGAVAFLSTAALELGV